MLNASDRKYKNLVIDTNNLFWRNFVHSTNTFKNSDDSNSELIFSNTILYGLNAIKTLIKDYGYDYSKIYCLFDNPNSTINTRRVISRGKYKHTRQKQTVPKQLYKTLKVFSEILQQYSDNYIIIWSQSLEADDLTWHLKDYIRKENNNDSILYVSSDLDWARNIDDYGDWYNWGKLYNQEQFYKKYEFWPNSESIKMFKTIRGDNSDNIEPAVPYLPIQIVLDIVRNYTSPDVLLAKLEETNYPSKWKKKIKENHLQIKINYQLVNFYPVEYDLEESMIRCKKNITQLRVWYKILGLPLESWMKTKKENELTFFEFMNHKLA